LFHFGQLVATPGALAALEKSGQNPMDFVSRHITGDWGELSEDDRKENQLSLQKGFRILGSYQTNAGEKVWVITEADRSRTTILRRTSTDRLGRKENRETWISQSP
jgi:hypothetical protein